MKNHLNNYVTNYQNVYRHFFKSSAFQEFQHIVWKPNVHSRRNNRPIFYPIPRHNNPVQNLTFYSFKIPLPYPPSTTWSSKCCSLSQDSHQKSTYISLFSATHSTCTTQSIILHLAGSTYFTVLLLILNTILLCYTPLPPQAIFMTLFDAI